MFEYRGLTIPKAKECVKDRWEQRRIVGGQHIDDPRWSKLYEAVKAMDALICFALGLDSSKLLKDKSVVWVEPMLCVLGGPKFLGKHSLLLIKTGSKF